MLEKLKALYPEYVGPDNPYLLLANVFPATVRLRRPNRRSLRNWRCAMATRSRPI